MYGTQWEPHMGIISNQLSFETMKSPCNIVTTTHLQTPVVFGASEAKSLVSFQAQEHDQHQIEVPAWCFEFPKITASPTMICQHEFTNTTTKQDPPTSQFTSSLYSVAESFLSSTADIYSHSSSEKYSSFQARNMPFYDHFPQEHDKLVRDEAARDERLREISFQRNQLASRIKPEKQDPRHCGVACVTSCNSASRKSKRRIRWTKDLHEPFMVIVNRLGGPEKAKPKAILEMMKSDLLSISHVKSHLQKCRSTIHIQKTLQERSEERQRTDGVTELPVKILMQIEESKQLQLEVRRSISQQMEMQRNLQMLIEQQNKKLKALLDHQEEGTKLKKILDTELEVTVPK